MAVLPDLVHVLREVAVAEGDVEAAVVTRAGDAPAAGTHRGPREVDVRSGAGLLGLLVGSAPALGRRTPGHRTPVEFLRLAAAALRPGGCYAANLADGPPLAGSTAPLPVAELTRLLAGDIFPARFTEGEDLAALVGRNAPVTDAAAVDSPSPPGGAFSIG
ncbi:hypothetical protein ACGF13_10305 [Kitasatospora sp. NPDC048286]|uniref:hypothetical protein n=1 Tax=Kitasatospora sp. NPDC048286 TaxID=3364047 RepID=UPI00372119AF